MVGNAAATVKHAVAFKSALALEWRCYDLDS